LAPKLARGSASAIREAPAAFETWPELQLETEGEEDKTTMSHHIFIVISSCKKVEYN
jgi:hypothetical protein